jgi:hypothetical protein
VDTARGSSLSVEPKLRLRGRDALEGLKLSTCQSVEGGQHRNGSNVEDVGPTLATGHCCD